MLLNENLFETLNEETSDRSKVGGKEIAKQQAIKEMANIDFEVGHTFDPDDFDYFKKVCKEDGWNVTEEDFQKYFEYLDEIRANRFADEDSDIDLGGWEEMESKQVEDSDGFMTDYTWYVKDNEDGSETHVMIFGDQDLYNPLNSEPDAEFDGEDAAREWFDNYKGFAEDLDESIDNDEIYNGYVVRKSDISDNYFVYDNNGHVEDDEHKGQGYPTKEAAIERANSLEKGIAKSNSDLEEAIKPNIESEELKALAQKHNIKILDAMSNGDLRMEGAGADLMKFYQEAEKLGLWEVNPELYEATITMSKAEMDRLDKEVEEAIKDVAQYNIKLKKRSDGSVEPDFSDLPEGKNIDDAKKAYDRYVKANAARPDRAKNKIIYDENVNEELDLSNVPTEALKLFAKDIHNHFNGKYNIDVLDGFKIHIKDIKDDLSKEIAKAKSIVDNNIEVDVEKLSDGSYVYMLKKKETKQIKEEVNEALYGTDELSQFIEVSRDLGFIGPAQMKHILDAGRKQGKSDLETLLWVKETFDGKLPDSLIDGLTDEFLDIAKEIGITDQHSYELFVANEVEPGETYTQAIKRYKQELLDAGVDLSKLTESKLDEIAVLNINEPAIFDAIANAKAYIHEKKYSQAKDSLDYAANLLVEPMNESAMSNLDLEIKEAGGKKNWKEKARQELADMIENLEYLKTYAPKEVNAGGNYDSIADLQADIEDLEKAINDLNAKLDYVDSIKTIGGDQE